MTDHLCQAFPELGQRVCKIALADLPTPVTEAAVSIRGQTLPILVKRDDLTSKVYGGNKVRKLEYLLRRAVDRDAARVATFGTVASNHALATALHARTLELACTCFLSHQVRTPKAATVLNLHIANGTEIIRYGGDRRARIGTLREHLQHRNAWLIPMGGSSWLGVIGFVNAGLELASQVASGDIAAPDFVYVANGTMATTAGIALGLALAGSTAEVQAVRVTHSTIANREALYRLMKKTVVLMRRLDASVPEDLVDRTRLKFRNEFFGDGYAHPTPEGERAISIAREQIGLELDSTYTGKAMAALLHDIAQMSLAGKILLFWNTYNSRRLPLSTKPPADTSALPGEFLRYFD